jgi:hypothetical protein
MKQLTPLKAIRKKCIDCINYELKRIKDCQFTDCPLYLLRMGKGSRATLKRIRTYCLWCCCNQRNEVRLCPAVSCPLWEYRFGKRPQKKGISLPKILTTEGVSETKRA